MITVLIVSNTLVQEKIVPAKESSDPLPFLVSKAVRLQAFCLSHYSRYNALITDIKEGYPKRNGPLERIITPLNSPKSTVIGWFSVSTQEKWTIVS